MMMNEGIVTRGCENSALVNSSATHQIASFVAQSSSYLDRHTLSEIDKKKILIVDSDPFLRSQVNELLTREGYLVMEATCASEMDSLLTEFEADMIVLDVMLPDEDGLSTIKRVRKQHSLDMVVLSSLSGIDHRVNGLSSGAGYYLTKPVDMRELLAVIRNRLMSRNKKSIQGDKKWILKTKHWQVTTPDGETYSLNNTEFTLLSLLAEHARLGKPATKQELYDALDKKYLPESRSLDLKISRLRQRFSNKNNKFPLRTLRNIGYELTENITVTYS